ncbi:hypothetical protein PIB30_056116 [Stylosanthes scabra]|uniref:Uncharacterized protein n=1 Tax=Stylosanthes scabra TaxID=79078 RepID=A0ABU6QJP4_9FABA|nr:hypothetical protein [Stylosanthes scabra]
MADMGVEFQRRKYYGEVILCVLKLPDTVKMQFYEEKKEMDPIMLQHECVHQETKGTQVYPCFCQLRSVVIEGCASSQTIVQHIGFLSSDYQCKIVFLYICKCLLAFYE